MRVGCQVRVLKDGRHARRPSLERVPKPYGLPVELDGAAVGSDESGDDADQCGLARAVFPYQRVNFAGCKIERDIIECVHRIKPLANPADTKAGRQG